MGSGWRISPGGGSCATLCRADVAYCIRSSVGRKGENGECCFRGNVTRKGFARGVSAAKSGWGKEYTGSLPSLLRDFGEGEFVWKDALGRAARSCGIEKGAVAVTGHKGRYARCARTGEESYHKTGAGECNICATNSRLIFGRRGPRKGAAFPARRPVDIRTEGPQDERSRTDHRRNEVPSRYAAMTQSARAFWAPKTADRNWRLVA